MREGHEGVRDARSGRREVLEEQVMLEPEAMEAKTQSLCATFLRCLV